MKINAKRFNFLILLVMLLNNITIACSKPPQPQSNDLKTIQLKPILEEPDGIIGDRISTKDFTLSVISVEEKVSYGSDKPKTGNKYISIEVNYECLVDYCKADSFYARIQDSDGNIYFIPSDKGKAPSLESNFVLSKGNNINRWITYEVPETAKNFLFIYEVYDSTDSQRTIIRLEK